MIKEQDDLQKEAEDYALSLSHPDYQYTNGVVTGYLAAAHKYGELKSQGDLRENQGDFRKDGWIEEGSEVNVEAYKKIKTTREL